LQDAPETTSVPKLSSTVKQSFFLIKYVFDVSAILLQFETTSPIATELRHNHVTEVTASGENI